ncbi:MAG: hypothetical protein JWN99_612 [Ilumatobacteraceae bacterium]|nr:hypothetical protein [Ilumatobacteraceae bacterium]
MFTIAMRLSRRGGARRSAGLAVAAALLAAGCTQHMVGPARTLDDYQRKARTTAHAAQSAVETVLLLAQTAADGKAFAPYTGIGISEQEDAFAGVQGDFGSIQPPDDRADKLRDQLNEILGAAMDDIATVRIAARRGELDDLATVAAPLSDDSKALEQFIESIS